MTLPGPTEPPVPLPDEGGARHRAGRVSPAAPLASPRQDDRQGPLDPAHAGPAVRGAGERRDRSKRPFDPERESRQALIHAATHDPLTDLPNRSLLLAWLDERTSTSGEDRALAVLFIDLDRFKLVNDIHGHARGDDVLVEAAHRLSSVVRSVDIVARLGGDEFVVGLSAATPASVQALAGRVLEVLRRPHRMGARSVEVTASIGIAFGGAGATADTLLADADAALYRSKRAGRDRFTTYDDEVRRAVDVRLGGETDLRQALARSEIFAHYQPIYDARTGEPVAAEALARWVHPGRGLVSPSVFVPMAEETGLIFPLGDAVMDAATAALAHLDRLLDVHRSTLWINVSSRQLEDPRFASRLVARVEGQEIAGRIGIEIIEATSARDVVARERTLLQLDAAGMHIALEDVGIGYPSLALIARRPVHTIKIDRSFVDDLGSARTARVVAAIVELAHALGATTRAEGIETITQLAQARELGVDLVSGYLLGRPDRLDRLPSSIAATRELLRRGGRS